MNKKDKIVIITWLLLLPCVAYISCRSAEPVAVNTSTLPELKPSPSVPTSKRLLVEEDSSIRRVDFSNFTYDWYPAWADAPDSGKRIILNNGSMQLGVRYGKEPREFFLTEGENYGVTYGDLTGDSKEEALVVLGMITSGTARANLIFIYTMLGGKPIRLWVYETGDRSDYGYHKAFIQEGRLLVEQYKPKIIEYQGQKHDTSSSDTYVRRSYKWNGKSFTETNMEELPVESTDNNPWVVQAAKPSS